MGLSCLNLGPCRHPTLIERGKTAAAMPFFDHPSWRQLPCIKGLVGGPLSMVRSGMCFMRSLGCSLYQWRKVGLPLVLWQVPPSKERALKALHETRATPSLSRGDSNKASRAQELLPRWLVFPLLFRSRPGVCRVVVHVIIHVIVRRYYSHSP